MKTNQDMMRPMGKFNVIQQPKEQWMDIIGYNGLYKISSYGRVMSYRGIYPKILNGSLTQKGYLRVSFHIRPVLKQFLIHRLVANAFIPNKDNLPEINHINGNKIDNRVENLEWCDAKYNSWHKINVLGYKMSPNTRKKISDRKKGIKLSENTREKIAKGHVGLKRSSESIKKTALAQMKKVSQFDRNGNLIEIFESMKDAAKKTNTSISCISAVCNGKYKYANGYVWKFHETARIMATRKESCRLDQRGIHK